MKFDIQKIKSTFQSFNTYQKIAGVVLALAIPLSIGLGISAIGANSGTDGGSFSQMVSSITSVVKPSSVISSSSLASSSKKAVKVSLKPSSVEEDLEVQVVGENGQMIVGPEFVTGSSRMKSGTGQKMILNMITTSVMIQLGRVKGNKMVNMQLSNKKLIDRGTRMIVEELGLDYGKARDLLLMHGSVKKAVDAYRNAQ